MVVTFQSPQYGISICNPSRRFRRMMIASSSFNLLNMELAFATQFVKAIKEYIKEFTFNLLNMELAFATGSKITYFDENMTA